MKFQFCGVLSKAILQKTMKKLIIITMMIGFGRVFSDDINPKMKMAVHIQFLSVRFAKKINFALHVLCSGRSDDDHTAQIKVLTKKIQCK